MGIMGQGTGVMSIAVGVRELEKLECTSMAGKVGVGREVVGEVSMSCVSLENGFPNHIQFP